jgi:predicted permease
MRLHETLRADRLEAAGMSRIEAVRESRRRFGNRLRLLEESRERWLGRALDDLGRDVRFGWRGLRRNAGFTFVVLVTLALGTGANGAIFRLYDVLRLRFLPVSDPQQISLIGLADQKGWRGSQAVSWPALTNLQWEYFRDQQTVFDRVFAWSPNTFGLGDEAKPAQGLFVSGGFFTALGVRPALGRVFRSDEDRRGCGTPGAVLGHAFWQREFGSDPTLIGRSITLNHVSVPVVGVAEPAFTGLEVGARFDVAVPICSQAALWNAGNWLDDGAVWWLAVMGRNARGRGPAVIEDGLRALSPALFGATLAVNYPRENAADYLRMRLTATPAPAGVSVLRDRYANSLTLLLVATGLVLLLMSANLGNLVLARSSARAHEFELRLSIGASRASLVRQLLVENAILASVGSAAGFVVAGGLSRLLVRFLATADGAPFFDLRPTTGWLLYSLVVAAVCGLVFGLLPASRVSRADAAEVLRGTGRVTAAGAATALRKLLVVAQVALSLVLVFGALLFVRTLRNALSVDVGFTRTGIITSWIDFRRLELSADQRREVRREILTTIRATPGVAAAAETSIIPLAGSSGNNALWNEGGDPSHAIHANTQLVSGGYVATMGIPVLAGRDFDAHDVVGSPRVVVVNQSLARQLGLGANPVGRRLRREASPWEPETTYEVIGLIRDTKYASVMDDFEPTALFPSGQGAEPGRFVEHVIRIRGGEVGLEAALQAALKTKYPTVHASFRRLETTVADGLMRERLLATVSGILGGLAVLIAAIGVYGVIAYLVLRRTNEFGVRMALGATSGHIVRTVTRQAMALVLVGLAIGVGGALAAGQAARSLLFGLTPTDLPTLTVAASLLIAVAVAAAYVPARRAARLDALTALRRE